MIISVAIAALVMPGQIGIGNDSDTAYTFWRSTLLFPTPSTPIQTNAVIARLPTFDAVGADRLLFAALDFPRLTWPTSRA